jgi:hypothetical protein
MAQKTAENKDQVGQLHLQPEDVPDERTRYLGVLGLLTECSPYVDDELRERIMEAFDDACADGRLTWRRIADRVEIEVVL